MTGWVDRINASILGRLRPSPETSHAVQMIADIETLTGLAAATRDHHTGATTMLVAELPTGRTLRVDEHDPGWQDVITALDRSGRTAQSSREWTLRLAADPTVPIDLIEVLAPRPTP